MGKCFENISTCDSIQNERKSVANQGEPCNESENVDEPDYGEQFCKESDCKM